MRCWISFLISAWSASESAGELGSRRASSGRVAFHTLSEAKMPLGDGGSAGGAGAAGGGSAGGAGAAGGGSLGGGSAGGAGSAGGGSLGGGSAGGAGSAGGGSAGA